MQAIIKFVFGHMRCLRHDRRISCYTHFPVIADAYFSMFRNVELTTIVNTLRGRTYDFS